LLYSVLREKGTKSVGMLRISHIHCGILSALLVLSPAVQAQAPSRVIDEGTARRGYGDPLPGGRGQSPGSPVISIVDAARSGDVSGARGAFLLGESVNARDGRGNPALLLAAGAGNVAVMRFLLEKGANPNLFDRKKRTTPLIAAAELGESNMIRLLLEYNADPNRTDATGETALMKAARIGAADAVRVLIAAKADLNATDYSGHTALWHADNARKRQVVKLLQEAGGD
jgi:uncharacterized protein